jgi:hypothetical protein
MVTFDKTAPNGTKKTAILSEAHDISGNADFGQAAIRAIHGCSDETLYNRR